MPRDWMVQGGQPSGICGAALILADRMNNFRRSVREVAYVVKIADLTIQKCLDEFKDTKSGDVAVEEFRNIWLGQAHNLPSYRPKASKRCKRVRDVNDDGEVIKNPQNITIIATPIDLSPALGTPTLLRLLDKPLRLDADGFVIPGLPVPSPLSIASLPGTPIDITDPPPTPQGVKKAQDDQHSAIMEEGIESEIASLLEDSAASTVEGLREADRKLCEENSASTMSEDPNNLPHVDDDFEVQNALLTEAECDLKEKIWVELTITTKMQDFPFFLLFSFSF